MSRLSCWITGSHRARRAALYLGGVLAAGYLSLTPVSAVTPGDIVLGDITVIRLRTASCGVSAEERASLVQDRINQVLAIPNLTAKDVHIVNTAYGPTLYVRKIKLITVDPATAQDAGETQLNLAKSWAHRLMGVISQVDIREPGGAPTAPRAAPGTPAAPGDPHATPGATPATPSSASGTPAPAAPANPPATPANPPATPAAPHAPPAAPTTPPAAPASPPAAPANPPARTAPAPAPPAPAPTNPPANPPSGTNTPPASARANETSPVLKTSYRGDKKVRMT